MKKTVYFLVMALSLAAAVWLYIFQPRQGLNTAEADYEITANDLVAAFNIDEPKATEMYVGKVLEVSGEVTEQVKDETSEGVLLNGGAGGFVYCTLAEEQSLPKIGEMVKLRCRCTGYLMDVILNDCMVIAD